MFEISGAAPASHFANGYVDAVSERQPAMYFPKGGGTIKGESKPGEIVWSRVYIENDTLQADLGRGTVVTLPAEIANKALAAKAALFDEMGLTVHLCGDVKVG